MATPTPNLGLVKPDMTDEIDQSIPAIAANFGTIDAATGKLSSLTTADKSSLVSAISENANGIVALKADVAQRAVNVMHPPSSLTAAVGDSVVDDTTAIQAIINYLSGLGGGTVFFPYTTTFYKITAALLVPSNITLMGDWNRPKIKQTGLGTSVANGAVITNSSIGSGSNTNIHICNLTIENQYQSYLVAGTSVPAYLYGIIFGEVTNSSITNCYVLNCISECIYIGATSGPSTDIIISNNRIENGCASGIAITNGKKIRIIDNYLTNMNVFGIDLEPNTGCVAQDIIIKGNHIDTVRADYFKQSTTIGQINALGISIQTGSLANQTSDIVVALNTIRNVKRYTSSGLINFGAILVNGANYAVVADNAIESCDAAGICIRGASTHINANNNTINSCYYTGIIARDSCLQISLNGNVIDCTSSVGSSHGISLNSSTYIVAMANQITNANSDGISMTSCSHVNITGCNIVETRSGGSRTMVYGIHVITSNDAVNLSGNMIYNSTGNGVQNADGSTNVYETGNTEDSAWRIRSANLHLYSDGTFYILKFRSGTATPVSAVTPRFIGEEYLNTSGPTWYKATGLVNTNWVALN